jgi:UPF0176 protein
MQMLNIAGYKFINLMNLEVLRERLLEQCFACELRGTILISQEGINLNLAGHVEAISTFKNYLKSLSQFSDMTFRESYSDNIPFKRLKVKIKKEIITFRQNHIHPETRRSSAILPEELKQWLDENRDITILDTRNDYEVRFGTFKNAMHLAIDDFCDLTKESAKIPRNKPIVMFCTGGIRCEKVGLYLEEQGYSDVFQLEGGILNYFNKVGGKHYEGECFVFDERIALAPTLKTTGTTQCTSCNGPIPPYGACTTCSESTHQSRNL